MHSVAREQVMLEEELSRSDSKAMGLPRVEVRGPIIPGTARRGGDKHLLIKGEIETHTLLVRVFRI